MTKDQLRTILRHLSASAASGMIRRDKLEQLFSAYLSEKDAAELVYGCCNELGQPTAQLVRVSDFLAALFFDKYDENSLEAWEVLVALREQELEDLLSIINPEP